MTDQQQGFYLLLCMSGRVDEAVAYREECERKEREKKEAWKKEPGNTTE